MLKPDGPFCYLVVAVRRGEVEDEFYLGIVHHLLGGAGFGDSVLLRPSLGALHDEVGACDDVEAVEYLAVLEVDPADESAPHDPNFHRFH
jgi:hypothetical protein